jgi:hypothetical protein
LESGRRKGGLNLALRRAFEATMRDPAFLADAG